MGPRDPREIVARRIREARQSAQLTQAGLAKKVGVPLRMIQHFERGQRITLDKIIAIADALGKNPNSFLSLGALSIVGALMLFGIAIAQEAYDVGMHEFLHWIRFQHRYAEPVRVI